MVESLHQELKTTFLTRGHVDDVHEEVETELSALILAGLKPKMTERLKHELRDTLEDEIRQQLKTDLTKRTVNELKAELKQELWREVKTALTKSLHAEFKIAYSENNMRELIQEAKTETQALLAQGLKRKLEDGLQPETDAVIRGAQFQATRMVIAPATKAVAGPSKPPAKKRKTSRK